MNKRVLLVSGLMLSMMAYGQEEVRDSISTEPKDEKVLQTVELIGRARRDYNSDYSFSASKIALKNMEVAQAVSTVTKELLADRQVFRLGDAVKNVSGVSTTSFYNHYAIRGVTQSAGNRENRLINGMSTSTYYFNQPLTVNIERIEVIKGPASMAFSSTDPGGTINMVTKKPLRNARKEVSFTVGSFGTIRSALDFTGPLNKSKSLLYRLNVGYENSQSFRDLQFKKAYMIAPTITYAPNDKTSLNFELVLSDDTSRLDRGQPTHAVNVAKGEKYKFNTTPINTAIGKPNDYNRNIDVSIMGNLTHKFTDDISLNMSYMKHIWNEDLSEHRPNGANGFIKDENGNFIPNLVEIRYVARQQKFFTDNFNAYFNANWKIGEEVKNKTVLGYDVVSYEVSSAGGMNQARGEKFGVARFNIDDPNSYYTLGTPSNYTFEAKRRRPANPMAYTTNGIYLMNHMEWDKLIFSFGLRQEWFTDKFNYKTKKEKVVKQNKLSKRFGLMYKATKNINAYASYIEGFQIQTDAYIGTNQYRFNVNGDEIYKEPFAPATSRMIEGGLKTEWFDGKLNANIAYFDIQQKNILIEDYKDATSGGGELHNPTDSHSRGLEVDIMGRVLPNWQVNLGYAFVDANFIEDGVKAAKGNTPKHSFNLWTRYDIKEGALKDFGIGVGANYVGEKNAWMERRNLSVPAYTVVDAALYYKLKSMQVAVNVNNVFGKTYWLGAFDYTRLFPGTPRNIMLNVRYNF
ncbi:MAG: TonB-dependent siderophore receptor [Flavobacteriaceae bacterium]|nr:TonB-dependent siderophore receptor [Flavobacteriaceae bacterium]